ncbi:MAG: universal stress protein [Oligoflexales bacterium]
MNILIAVELNQKEDQQIIYKTLELVKNRNSKIHLVHVVRPIYNFGMISTQILLECLQKHEAYARKKVSELGACYKVPKEFQFVKVGYIKEVITDLIHIIDADLLVMGNHDRHGFAVLIHRNKTINLLKHLDCDVLAVKVA